MNKFEQLIEYVINDEEGKARELFHDIVVEKSRQIYEEMMEEETVEEAVDEELDEAESTHTKDDRAEKAGRKVTKDIEYDEKHKMEEGMEEAGMMGGDQADDLIDDVEVEEEGMNMEGEGDDEDEMMPSGEGEGDLEDRVVDLEDKLDELMAEFEALMDPEAGDDMDGMGSDDMEVDAEMDGPDGMTDIEVDDDELETEGMMYNENVTLKAVAKPSNSGVASKSPVAANAGARGAMAHPVKMTGDTAKGRPAPAVKDMPGYQGDGHYGKPGAAPKPHLAQAAGVNTTSVIK